MRDRIGDPRTPTQEDHIEAPFAKARAALPKQAWDREYRRGRTMNIEEALTDILSASTDRRT
jgi:hypothetical protein